MPKNWTMDQKFAIVLEGIKGSRPVAEICRNHGISQAQYYKWRDGFLEGAKEGLKNNRERISGSPDKARIEELEKALGRAAMQIEILKKTEEWMKGR